jgi:hypothetical protein
MGGLRVRMLILKPGSVRPGRRQKHGCRDIFAGINTKVRINDRRMCGRNSAIITAIGSRHHHPIFRKSQPFPNGADIFMQFP